MCMDKSTQTSPKKVKYPEVTRKNRTIKILQQRLKRKTARVRSLKDLITLLRKNNKSSYGLENVLQNNFEGLMLHLAKSEIQNSKVAGSQRRYSDEMKKFALTLYFYSPKAYNFVRKQIKLPHSSRIRNWLSSHNCEVGFLTEVFNYLKNNVQDNAHMQDVSLIFDSMAIRSQIVYDKKIDKHCGYVDYGGIAAPNLEELATEALVFQIVSYSKKFKIPIAYFFINKISGNLQCELLKLAIGKLNDIGICVRSITCDGCATNMKTLHLLGFQLSSEKIISHIKHPNNNTEIYCILDPCHMLKLCRNSLAETEISSSLGPISFKFIKRLHDLQEKENFKFANSLSNQHINFSGKKMNVKLAAQTISASVADAIDFLRRSGNSDFFYSEATTEFIRIFDRLFDMMNSRNIYAKGFKSPLSLKNKEVWENIFKKSEMYIKQLKIGYKNILQHVRKTFALGFLVNISSYQQLANDLLKMEGKCLKYFLAYKTSQDHLELQFCCIRSRTGWNNNPNSLQFKWALRKLLFSNNVTPSINANCVDFEEGVTTIFDFRSTNNLQIEENKYEDDELTEMILNIDRVSLSSIQKNILYYISGFIVRRFLSKSHCKYCHNIVLDKQSDHNYTIDINVISSFTTFVSEGKLCIPSTGVFKVIEFSEKIYKSLITAGHCGKKNFKLKLVSTVSSHFIPLISRNLFASHPITDSCNDIHEVQLIKFLANYYSDLRIYTDSKKMTQRILGNKAGLRQKLNKTILFYNI